MVSYKTVQASNSTISSSLPPGLIAIFVGATSGIGEYTLKRFAKHSKEPRVYFVGRSQEARDRISAECKTLNPDGEYIFIKADTGLIHNVDEICRDISSRETAINLLFLSTGSLNFDAETSEGLPLVSSLTIYSRNRFILNLLPLLQQATALRRVVSVFTATKEGPIDVDDFQGRRIPMLAARGQASSMVTLSLEALAKKAPDVSFIHNFPGPVKSGITRGTTGPAMFIVKSVFAITGPFVNMCPVECGERHLFLATSARYPAADQTEVTCVPMQDGLELARGTNGAGASGVYSIDAQGESASSKVEQFLAKLRSEGMVEKVWKDSEEQFHRITSLDR